MNMKFMPAIYFRFFLGGLFYGMDFVGLLLGFSWPVSLPRVLEPRLVLFCWFLLIQSIQMCVFLMTPQSAGRNSNANM